MAIKVMRSGEFTMSEDERKNLEDRLDKLSDDDIDYSDIPELTEEDWDKAITYSQFIDLHRTTS